MIGNKSMQDKALCLLPQAIKDLTSARSLFACGYKPIRIKLFFTYSSTVSVTSMDMCKSIQSTCMYSLHTRCFCMALYFWQSQMKLQRNGCMQTVFLPPCSMYWFLHSQCHTLQSRTCERGHL